MKLKDLIRKPRFAWIYPLVIWLFLTAKTTGRRFALGVCVALLGEAIRLWANGHVGHRKVNQTGAAEAGAKIGQLVTSGPYAFVRHPLYFGTFLIGAGFCILVGNSWLAATAFIFFVVVYRAKMAEEEATLLNEWGEQFLRYQRAVPRWFPTGRRSPSAGGRWSWRGIISSKEWKTCLWLMVCVMAIYLRAKAAQEGEWLTGPQALKHAVVLGALVTLVVIDGIEWVVKRLSKHRAARRLVQAV